MDDSENAVPQEADAEVGAAAAADVHEYDVPYHVQDWFLQELIELADLGLQQWITLDIGGSHINGRLISGRQYFEQLAESTKAATFNGGGALQETLVNLYNGHAKIYLADDDEGRPAFGEAKPSYIHLREARWHSTDGKTLPGNGTYWRGKVSSVDGYMLGELRVTRD